MSEQHNVNKSHNTDKISKSMSKSRIFLIVLIVLIAIGTVLALIILINSKFLKEETSKSLQTNLDIPKSPTVQPVGSPNAGSLYGSDLKTQIEKSTKEAEVLAVEISKIPSPKTTDEKIALSKKNLELGKLYLLAMMHKETIEALTKVEYIEVNDYSESRAHMGKAAVAIGSAELAKRFYNQALSALKPVPENTDKINEYKAAIALIGN